MFHRLFRHWFFFNLSLFFSREKLHIKVIQPIPFLRLFPYFYSPKFSPRVSWSPGPYQPFLTVSPKISINLRTAMLPISLFHPSKLVILFLFSYYFCYFYFLYLFYLFFILFFILFYFYFILFHSIIYLFYFILFYLYFFPFFVSFSSLLLHFSPSLFLILNFPGGWHNCFAVCGSLFSLLSFHYSSYFLFFNNLIVWGWRSSLPVPHLFTLILTLFWGWHSGLTVYRSVNTNTYPNN